MDAAWFLRLLNIILVNIMLSGDNAVLIAMATKDLPEHLRGRSVFWGSVGAVACQVLLTMMAAWLLQVPLLQAAGGILLAWIALGLMIGDKVKESERSRFQGNLSLFKAIQAIIVANIVMSLDNVVAVAGIAESRFSLLLAGLAVSIPVIIGGSATIGMLMRKVPVLVYAGAAVLSWTAGEILLKDHVLHRLPIMQNAWLHWVVPIVMTGVTLVSGWVYKWRNRNEDGLKRVRSSTENR
jgi:YjbE family integral membrane protein